MKSLPADFRTLEKMAAFDAAAAECRARDQNLVNRGLPHLTAAMAVEGEIFVRDAKLAAEAALPTIPERIEANIVQIKGPYPYQQALLDAAERGELKMIYTDGDTSRSYVLDLPRENSK